MDMDDAIPTYGEDALMSRDVFFMGQDSVHFFVEDADQENLYELLLRRCFPELDRLEVFPQGGKKAVLAHASAGYERVQGIKRIYILDKDFDDLLGRIRLADGIFYLDQFSVENMLFNECGVLEVCVQEFHKSRKADLQRTLNFDHTVSVWFDHLDRLHRAFLLVQRFELGIPNTKTPVDNYVYRGERHVFDIDAVHAYVESVRLELILKGVLNESVDFENLMANAFPEQSLKYVNGKYLFALIYFHIKSQGLARNIRGYSLVYRCAGACDLGAFESFTASVRAYLAEGDMASRVRAA